MRKLYLGICLFAVGFMFASCGSKQAVANETVKEKMEVKEVMEEKNNMRTNIILTINGKALKGYLNASEPAESFKVQLPKTVRLNDSGNDFCGDNIDVKYKNSDISKGYKNGDIAFWPPAHNFVIFKNGQEHSQTTGDLVILGHITESQSVLDALEGNLEVKIEVVK